MGLKRLIVDLEGVVRDTSGSVVNAVSIGKPITVKIPLIPFPAHSSREDFSTQPFTSTLNALIGSHVCDDFERALQEGRVQLPFPLRGNEGYSVGETTELVEREGHRHYSFPVQLYRLR